jgi:hypothetical protein
MAQRRDRLGRFAGSGGGGKARTSGTFRTGSRAAGRGKDARSDASLMRTLKGGEKEAGTSLARNARIAGKSRTTATGSDAKLIGRSERSFGQRANQSKVRQGRMERERQSFARKGARRGGS